MGPVISDQPMERNIFVTNTKFYGKLCSKFGVDAASNKLGHMVP